MSSRAADMPDSESERAKKIRQRAEHGGYKLAEDTGALSEAEQKEADKRMRKQSKRISASRWTRCPSTRRTRTTSRSTTSRRSSTWCRTAG